MFCLPYGLHYSERLLTPPFFSVVIPVYNKEQSIPGTLCSVLEQEFADYEVVVVDDGSTDNSLEYLKSVNNPRLRLYSIENRGPAGARNYGISQARGRWVVVLDADDLLLSNALISFSKAIQQWPSADIIISNFYDDEVASRTLHINGAKEGMVSNPFRAWFYRDLMPCAGAFVCRRGLLLLNHYDESLRRSEDQELVFRLFRVSRVAIIALPTMVYRHMYSTESKKLPPIELDFKGHLSFDRDKMLWEKICLYELYIEAKNYYPDDAARLYPFLRRRYGLIMAYHISFWIRAILR